jgi:hypothetical protein
MALAVIRTLYPDDETFARSIHPLLRGGDVRLLSIDGPEVPQWRWRELFVAGGLDREMPQLKLSLTKQGARFIS